MFLVKAAKEGRLALMEGTADDDSKEGLRVALICEKFNVDKVGGRLHPLAIIIDDAMWPLIQAQEEQYEIFNQDGTAAKVKRVPETSRKRGRRL